MNEIPDLIAIHIANNPDISELIVSTEFIQNYENVLQLIQALFL